MMEFMLIINYFICVTYVQIAFTLIPISNFRLVAYEIHVMYRLP